MNGDSPIRKARLIAFYLPQFHPIPENDSWWGNGFTEWTNVARAHPLFRGHYQPHIPAELGFYDLCLPAARIAQSEMARAAGIEGFCYWHYWFAGKRLLERPFNEVLKTGSPDYPFCFGWANQTWSGIWHGNPNKILIEQTYPGRYDNEKHFYALLDAFNDYRYIRINGKPIFIIYRPSELLKAKEFIDQWQNLSIMNGIPGIHFISHLSLEDSMEDYLSTGYSGVIHNGVFRIGRANSWERAFRWYETQQKSNSPMAYILVYLRAMFRAIVLKSQKTYNRYSDIQPTVYKYKEAMLYFLDGAKRDNSYYPCVIPNWDNSPRSGNRAVIFHDSTPELFRVHLQAALELIIEKPFEERILFIKSWNEWAEGNYLEPDLRFGHKYIDVIRDEILNWDV